MRLKLIGACLSLVLGGQLSARGQTAVPVWETFYRPPSPGPMNAPGVASRELADGTILVATDQFLCVHFDHDGNPLSSIQLPVAAKAGAGKSNAGGSRGENGPLTDPPVYGEVHAAIDGFGRVAIAFVRNPDYRLGTTGDIETNKFDGLTGQALWPSAQIYGGLGGQYPTGVYLDRSGDVLVTGLTAFGTHNHVTIKYDGQTGAVIWGPMLISAYVAVSCLGAYGEVFVSIGGSQLKTLEYSPIDGSIVWGPATVGVPQGVAPSACIATPQGKLIVSGDTGSPRSFITAEYDSNGTLVWGPSLFDLPPGTDSAVLTGLDTDALGNVVITGWSSGGGVKAYETLKLSASSGDPLWGPVVIDATGVQNPTADVQVFGNGDVSLRALLDAGGERRLNFWRYRGSDGLPLWGPTDLGDAPETYPITYYTSRILSDGGVFGSAVLTASGPSAFALDGAGGGVLWGPVPFSVPGQGVAYFEDLTIGPDGNPVVLGNTLTELLTIKYDKATGNVLWGPVTFSSGDFTEGWQVQVDASGDVVVMAVTNAGPGGILLLKYDGTTGAAIWGPTMFPGLGPARLALDASGDAFVLAYGAADSELAKVSGATGSVLWGPAIYHSGMNQSDFPRSLAVDASGDAYVVGDSQPAAGIVWFVLKYSGASGSLLWGPSGGIDGQPFGVAAGPTGKVAVTGSGPGGMTTVAYDAATGAVAWGPNSVMGNSPYGDAGIDVVFEPNGDVVAAGTISNAATQSDFATIKYRGTDGATLWGPNVFDGSGLDDYVYVLGLGLDGSGNVVVGGTSYRGPHNADIAVLKYDGSSGVILWGPAYEGGAGLDPLLGFSVQGDEIAVGSPIDGAMFTSILDESFGIATSAGSIPLAYCGGAYLFTLVAQNGQTPYAWTLVSGSLPPGLTLSSTGVLSGTPTEQGIFTFRIQAQDSAFSVAQRDFTIAVLEGISPFVIEAAFDNPCQFTLSVSGSWSDILWLPGGETSPTITVSPTETTTYGAVVTGLSGCPYRVAITVPGTKLQNPACLAPTISSIVPTSGPAAGGTPVTIAGTNFEAGASVAFGGVAATNVVVVDPTQITADSPVLSPGRLYTVTVINSDTGNTALAGAWFADFFDVPPSNPFHDSVVTLVRNGVTAGCGGGNYCPASPATRAQMAVFLLKSKNGESYVPPPAIGLFNDVPVNDPFAPWIEELANLGVTAGCGGGNYCPGDPVTRAQMAVFLLKTLLGSSYVPPPAVGIFGDVPPGSFAADWIEDLYNRAITAGCNASPLLYCPGSAVTRGQMAPLLVKTFNLQ